MVSFKHVFITSLFILNGCLVATSMYDYYDYPTFYFPQYFTSQPPIRRQGNNAAQGFVDMLMYGLAGIPVYKAVEKLIPFFAARKQQDRDHGRVISGRHKRDLAYAQQLLSLLISVETELEKNGITEPQCQLRATCEIHAKNVNSASSSPYEKNFIKLVSKMRSEIQNPKVVPLAKYVFEYYEEAAVRGEQRLDCGKIYDRCPQSLDHFYQRTKGKTYKAKKEINGLGVARKNKHP